MSSQLTLNISLNVLEQLGINLYSNIPAVLSEVVANAWDADATEVSIDYNKDKGEITIQDNGTGMTRDNIQDRFLMVGYRRRDGQPGRTKEHGRRPMGRKGIGKLSLFSIAKTVKVFTAKDSVNSAFCMDVEEIKEQIKKNPEDGHYHPNEISTAQINFSRGTRIVLSNLEKKRIHIKALKRRLARRFSIIGGANKFQITVNEDSITPSDRGYFSSLRYIWIFGEDEKLRSLCTTLDTTNGFNQISHLKDGGIQVTGWIGSVHKVSQLKDDSNQADGDGNLNRIAIFARGKMMQEDILSDIPKRGVYSNYLVGELEIEGLDEYDGGNTREDDDAATTSRQKIIEDDPRYQKLCDLMSREVSKIGSSWRKWRGEKGLDLAKNIPAIKEWLNDLSSDDRTRAHAWLTKVGRIEGDDPEEKKRLIRHAVVAFEFFKANKNLEELENFSDEGLDVALQLFNFANEFEKFLYGQIVRSRIQVIKTLQEKCDENEIEKAIQKHIYNHLWLIDSSWERTVSDSYMERTVKKIFADVDSTLTEEEENARLDIGYRMTTGKHVIVELKRPEKVLKTSELTNQIEKYRTAILKALEKADRVHEPVEFICVLGTHLKEYHDPKGPETIEKRMKALDARIVYYDTLLDQASKAYQDYLDVAQKADRLAQLIKDIDDFSVDANQDDI